MKRNLFFILMILALAACSGEPEVVRETVIAELPVTMVVTREVAVQETVEVTREVQVTREVEVTRVVERAVTVTPTATPVNTPTPSSTPTITPMPTATPIPSATPTATATPDLAATATTEAFGALAAPKGDGFYTVGEEIVPGKWESTGTGSACYWERLDENQETLANHFGFAGGTITIRPNDYEVHFEDCGTWEYVEGAQRPLAEDAGAEKEDGFYTVGVEIAPGRWESTGSGDACYWERLDEQQNILQNHFGSAGGTMTIQASDYEVHLEDCGTWQYLGP